MNPLFMILVALLSMSLVAALGLYFLIRSRNLHCWIHSYALPAEPAPKPNSDDVLDVFIAICDHWEPECYGASREQAEYRVSRWREEYPGLFEQFRDVNGRPPQYSFFFPQDEYRPEYLDGIRPLCEAGFGEVEVHLHHHDDTPEQFREKLEVFRERLYHRHGLLRKDPRTGNIVYGFIHGNWALCNSRPDGEYCGVDQELNILRETGCYADLTLPSAPSETQTSTINSIYYARDLAGQRKSHDRGLRSRVGQTAPEEHLLMIQGPLTLDWQSRKYGLMPRIENGDLHGGRCGTARRMQLWIDCGVIVAGQPNWRFVKLHTHGCKNENIDTLLGAPMQRFYRELEQMSKENHNLRFHFVTAWEMAQRVHQAEQGASQPVLDQAMSAHVNTSV